MNATDVSAARAAAVASTIDRIRAIEAKEGVTRPALEKIRAELLKLAAQEHLFPSATFPPPADEGAVIRLLLLAVALLLGSWALLVLLARRLPPGTLKDLATVLPACATP